MNFDTSQQWLDSYSCCKIYSYIFSGMYCFFAFDIVVLIWIKFTFKPYWKHLDSIRNKLYVSVNIRTSFMELQDSHLGVFSKSVPKFYKVACNHFHCIFVTFECLYMFMYDCTCLFASEL